VTNSSSDEDACGWDYFVEFPTVTNNSKTQDKEHSIECKFQIKSSQSAVKELSVKLSVLDRLIKAPMPTFFLFIDFHKDPPLSPQAAYIVHVDKELISKVLRRLRENDLENTPKELHKCFMKISYKAALKVQINASLNIKEAIESFIPNGMNHYSEKKLSLLKNLGYEQAGFQLKFNMPSVQHSDLVDMSLGLIKSFDVTNSRLLDNRFNILNEKNPIKESDSAKISVGNPKPQKGELRFSETKFSTATCFDVNIFPLPFNPTLLKSEQTFLIQAKLFALVIKGLDFTEFSVRFTAENETSIEDIISFLILFSKDNNFKELFISLSATGIGPLFSGKTKIANAFFIKPQLGEALNNIYKSFHIKSNHQLSLTDLDAQEQNILILNDLLENKAVIRFTAPSTQDIKYEDKVTFIKSIGVQLRNIRVGGMFAIHTTKTQEEKNNIFTANEIVLLEPLTSSEPLSNDELDTIYKGCASKVNTTNQLIFSSD